MKDYEFHPIADAFPLMEGDEFTALAEDVDTNGLRDAIVLYQGKILDGRNRYRACIAGKCKPAFAEYEGDDPVSFVTSKNMHRRHLTTGQRTAAAAALVLLATRYVAESANLQEQLPKEGELVERYADELKVSPRGVRDAVKVLESGSEQIKEAMKNGEVKPSDAAAVANLPKSEQNAALKAKREGDSSTLREAVGDKEEKPLVDELGGTLPKPAIPAWKEIGVYHLACRHLDDLIHEVEELRKLPPGLCIHGPTIDTALRNAKSELVAKKPYCVCPYCKIGKSDCKGCRGRGWVYKQMARSV